VSVGPLSPVSPVSPDSPVVPASPVSAAVGGSNSPPVVDICEIAYDADSWRAYLGAFAAGSPRYLHVFARRLCDQAAADHDRYRQVLNRDPLAAIDILIEPGLLDVDVPRHLETMRAQNVVHQIWYGGMWKVPGGTVNDRVSQLVAGRPELRFWAGVTLKDPVAASEEMRRAHEDLRASGLSIIPFLDNVDVLGDDVAPVFAYAEAAGLPIWIHCGQSFASNRPLDACTWRDVDRLATRHPDLVLIAGHGGWPWMMEMAAVAQRHRNVYIDSSTHRASGMAQPGYGWEPVLARTDGALRGISTQRPWQRQPRTSTAPSRS
jgi:predicted TIM-barrel fold metal-dependent hydrolase